MEPQNLLIEKIRNAAKAETKKIIDIILTQNASRYSYLTQVTSIIKFAYYFFNAKYYNTIDYPKCINFYDFILKEMEYEDFETQHILRFNLNDIEPLNQFERDKLRAEVYFQYDKEIVKYLYKNEIINYLGLTSKGMKIYTKIKLMEHKNKDKPKDIIELKTQKILAKYINNEKIKNKTMKNFERLYIDNITL